MLQDFLAVVELAEQTGDELKLVFTTNGKPMVASFETDASIKVQMILATIREESLKIRQPQVSSYKELMGRYIEGRKAVDEVANNPTNFSISELHRVFSPSVETFAGNLRSKPSRSSAKRRSSETKEGEKYENDANLFVPDQLLLTKKKKPNEQVLSQQEELEVSKMLADLANADDDEEPYVDKSNILVNFERNIKVTLKSAAVESQSESESLAESGSIRFEGVNLPSEAIVPEKSDQEKSLPATDENFPRKTASQKIRLKKENELARKLFGAILEPKNISLPCTQVANSDPDSD